MGTFSDPQHTHPGILILESPLPPGRVLPWHRILYKTERFHSNNLFIFRSQLIVEPSKHSMQYLSVSNCMHVL